jgi:hypothetical protein
MNVQFQIGSAYATTSGTFLVLGRTPKTIQLQYPNGSVCTKTLRSFKADDVEFFYANNGAHTGVVTAIDMMPLDTFKSISNPPFDMPTSNTPTPVLPRIGETVTHIDQCITGKVVHIEGSKVTIEESDGTRLIYRCTDLATTPQPLTYKRGPLTSVWLVYSGPKMVCYISKDADLRAYFAYVDSDSDCICGGETFKECKESLNRLVSLLQSRTIEDMFSLHGPGSSQEAPTRKFAINLGLTELDTLTELQTEMLLEIQECENDGLGMGYSEFDGEGLTPQEKGVLGSLVAAGYVYNAQNEGSEPMYCSNPKSPTLTLANGPRDGIKGQNV